MGIGGKDGISYKHNFDIIFKWMMKVFTGETLDVLGIRTGKIVDVCGYEPVTLEVKEERIDVLLIDENGHYYQLEEERNLSRKDLYRFAAQHFLIAEQINTTKLTTVIVASGEVTKQTSLETSIAHFSPVIVNLTQRDGAKALAEMREQKSPNPVELVFLPMYGVVGKKHDEFAKDVIIYAKELYDQKKIELELLGALIVMCNKVIPSEALDIIWSQIVMLKVFEYAEKKGEEKGEIKGIKKVAVEMLRKGMEVSLISEVTKLSMEEVLKLKDGLEQKANL